MDDNKFFTFSGYMKKEDKSLTASMEDYLEMIYRLSRKNGFTRINELAEALNVQPPSATKMVQKLAELNLLNYEKYGMAILSPSGEKLGRMLLERHNLIHDFLEMLGVCHNVLEQTEKIEHTISVETLECLASLVNFFKERPEVFSELKEYQKTKRMIEKTNKD